VSEEGSLYTFQMPNYYMTQTVKLGDTFSTSAVPRFGK
jgi:hypothetical protein